MGHAMTQVSLDTPYVNGMNYGMGVNFLNGSIAGKAVDPGLPTPPTLAAGQTVRYTLNIINSFEDLYSSLGIAVDASGRFGLFSASAKFSFANESKFNSQSTFVLARCVVENAFTQVEGAHLAPDSDGYNLLKQGKQDLFQERYGDGFVRGLQTGGEYFAIISVTSTTREEQESIAASLSAKYGGLFASVSVDANLDSQTKSKMSQSQIQVSTYQRGGLGDETSITADVEGVMARLKAFPAQVKNNPVPYSAQLARYLTIPLPDGPNPIDIENQREALQAYAGTRLQIQSLINDINFVQTHPDLFVAPPSAALLNTWQVFLSDELTRVTRQASTCSDHPVDGCPSIPFTLPPDYQPVQRKVSNSIDVFAAPYSFPDSVFKRTIEAPVDFQIVTRLITNFKDAKLPGAAYYVGLALYADDLNRALWLMRGVEDAGPSISCHAFNQSWDNPSPETSIGSGYAMYYDDEIHLRLARKGAHLLDVSYSQDGTSWKQIASFVDLTAHGFKADTAYRLVYFAYSTLEKPVSGTFLDTNIVSI